MGTAFGFHGSEFGQWHFSSLRLTSATGYIAVRYGHCSESILDLIDVCCVANFALKFQKSVKVRRDEVRLSINAQKLRLLWSATKAYCPSQCWIW